MTVVNPKSISGINSITMASGSDNLLTIHTTNTTERLRINSSGDVIVGSGITVSPDGDIFATGVTTSTTFVGALTGNVTGNVTGNISGGTVAGSTGTFTGDVDIADKIVHTGDTNTAIRFPSADTITAETGGSERLRIDSSGRLLLGLTSDSRTTSMIISGNTSGATSFGVLNIDIGTTSVSADTNLGIIRFGATGDRRGADIRGMGEGTWSAGSSHPSRLSFYTCAASASSPTERLRINSSGQLLSGVTGNAGAADANAVFGGGGNAGTNNYGKLYITQSTSNPSSGTAIGFIGFSSQDLDNKPFAFMGVYADANHGTNDYPSRFSFWTTADGSSSASEKLRIASGGDVTVQTGNLVIGTSGKGIDFSATSGTGTSELLDDYEEGNFTPTVNAIASPNYTVAAGRYTKIGNLVTAQAYLLMASGGGEGSAFSIGSLPFTSTNTTYKEGGGSIIYENGFFDNSSTVSSKNTCVPWVPANATIIKFHKRYNGSAIFGNDTSFGTGANNVYLIVQVCYVAA